MSQSYDFATATFFFFKAVGRKPGGALAIAISQLLAYTVLVLLAFWSFRPLLNLAIEAETRKGDPSPAEALAALGAVGFGGLLVTVLAIMAALSIQAAWLRLLTRDEVKPVIPLRFGGDELRLLGVNIIFIAFWFIGIVIGSIISGLVLGAGGVGLFAASDSEIAAGLAVGLLGFLLFVVFAVLAIWLSLRFAAAPAMTVNEKRFRLFESFSATKGITGWMLLSYLVVIAIVIVGAIIIAIIQQIVVVAGLLGSLGTLEQFGNMDPDNARQVFEMLGQIFSEPGILAALIVVLLLQFAFQIVYEGLWHGIGAYAAVRHSGGEAARKEDISAPAGSVGDAPHEG